MEHSQSSSSISLAYYYFNHFDILYIHTEICLTCFHFDREVHDPDKAATWPWDFSVLVSREILIYSIPS